MILDHFTRIGAPPEDDRDLSAEALLGQMERAGVESALCSHTAAVRYDAAEGNARMAALCANHPRLRPIGVINPTAHLGVAEVIRAAARAGCVGLRFAPQTQGWALDSEPFARALEEAAGTGLPIAVELGGPGDATRLLRLAHGLGAPVILANVTYATLGEAIAVLNRDANLRLEASRLCTPGVVEALVNAVGAERLLWGSGAPAWEIAPTLRMIQRAEISDAAKRLILGDNARQLYHLRQDLQD